MSLLVGVDIGTQGTKAALFDDRGRCLGQAFEPSQLHRPSPGVVEEDPERQFGSVCRTIRRCVRAARAAPGEVVGIGLDGQMAGIIGIGRDGRAVTPYDSWLDVRCAPQIGQMQEAAGEQILRKTGNAPSFNHGPKKLWWMQARPKVYRQVAAFVQPGGYAAMRLCGLSAADAFIDHTYLHFSGFADNQAARWDATLVDRFGIDGAKLPRIVPPEQVVGELTRPAASACGLKAGIPVVAGCGDTAASFLACGATRPGVCVDVAGTASVFAATTAEFRPDVAARTLGCGRSAVPGLWHPYAYINGGGMTLEWFRELLRSAGAGRAAGGRARRPDLDLAKLDRAAAAVAPDPALPMCIPHFAGRVCPPQPELRGAWVGLSWNATAGHLYRAILESVALEYAVYRRILLALYGGKAMRQLRVTGGGERSETWNQIKADALQTPVTRIAQAEGAPRGVAMIAGVGTGVLRNLPAAAGGDGQWVAVGRTLRPNRRRAGFYESRREAYETLLARLNDASGVLAGHHGADT